jgi:hypothetical protein
MKVSELVGKYIELRDKKAALKAEYDKKVESLDAVLAQIEAKFLEVFQQTGINSVATEAGTAYQAIRTSATVADRDTFFDFVRSREEWTLLEARAAKTAVEQYKEAHGELPPGLNWREERVVNFRRSS